MSYLVSPILTCTASSQTIAVIQPLFMSIALQLQQTQNELAFIEQDLDEILSSVTVDSILNDPALVRPVLPKSESKELRSLDSYQLSSRLAQIEDAESKLESLFQVNNLVSDIEHSLSVHKEAPFEVKKSQLQSTWHNIQILSKKVDEFADIALGTSLRKTLEGLTQDYAYVLNEILSEMIPETSGEEFYIRKSESLSTEDYSSLVSDFESLVHSREILDRIDAIRTSWDAKIVDKFLSKSSYLVYSEDLENHRLAFTAADLGSSYLSSSFFESVRDLVTFINAGFSRFRGFYATKVSNFIVHVISENAVVLLDNREVLTDELKRTIQYFASSGWTVPIRNTLSSVDHINENLQSLLTNYMVDKSIDRVRQLFSEETLTADLQQLREIIEIEEVLTLPEEPEPLEQFPEVEGAIDQDDDGWEENWDSDFEDSDSPFASKKKIKTIKQEENWDDWDEDWDDPPAPTAKPTLRKKATKVATPVKVPKPVEVIPKPEPIKSVTTVSAVLDKLKDILHAFQQESDGADASDILEAIGALAVLEYPPISSLFLIFNDLRIIDEHHLGQIADNELRQFKQEFFQDITLVVDAFFAESDSISVWEVAEATANDLDSKISALCGPGHRETNPKLLEVIVVEILNFVNNLILEFVINSHSISEQQSEKYGHLLDLLEPVEIRILSKLGKKMTSLPTTAKMQQTKILLTNHLDEIMEFFYRGELYDYDTTELIKVIKSLFIESDKRSRCVTEIKEIRNFDDQLL